MKKIIVFLLLLILGLSSFADFLGKYYNGRNFDTYVGSRVDSNINFNWGSGSPGISGIGSDNFSVRWTGRLTAPERRQYEFQTYTDDGVRLYVTSPDFNNYLDIDNWVDSSPFTSDGRQIYELETGESLTLTMEYYEHGGGALSRLDYRYRRVYWWGTGYWTSWNTVPSSATTAMTEDPVGSFETINGTVATGWAYDPDVTDTINVKIYVDDTYWKTVTTDIFRDDVNGGGNYGFNIDLSEYTTDPGTYSIALYAVDNTGVGEYELNSSPKEYLVTEQSADPIQNIIFSLAGTEMNLGEGDITKTDEGEINTTVVESKLADIAGSINYDGSSMSFAEVSYSTGADDVYVMKQNLPNTHNDVGRAKLSRSIIGTETDETTEFNFVYPVGFDSIDEPHVSGDRITINWVENNLNKYRVYFKNQKIIFRISKYGTLKTMNQYLGENTDIREAETEINGESYLKTMLNNSDQYVDVVFDYYSPGSTIINDVLFSYSSGEFSVIGLPIDYYRIQVYTVREATNGAYTAYTFEGEKIAQSSIPKLDEYDITANQGVYLIDHIEKDQFPNLEVYFSTKTPFNAEINEANIFYSGQNELREVNETGEGIDVPMGEADLQTAELRDFKYPLDIVFAIDNSGSMQEEIDSVKDGMQSFVDRLSSKGFDVKINIVTFGPQQNYYYTNYYYGGTYSSGYPIGDWKDGNSYGQVEAYYDNSYLAVYKTNGWYSDVDTVKDAFENMLALYGYYGGQENGAWALHYATDLLERNGRTMKRDGTIVDTTASDYDGGEVGSIPSQKWIMLLTDENMDDDNLSGMGAGYTSYNVVSEISKKIAENGIILTGIFHVRSGVTDDMGNYGQNPSDTGDIYYNDFESYLGESFYMYEMGATGGLVGDALLDSVGNVGIIKRWKVAYTSPFPDKDGTYRYVNYDLDNVFDDAETEVEIVNKNDSETKKYKAPSESGAVLNANFVNPNYADIIAGFEGGGDINDFNDLIRYRELYGDYGKVANAATDIMYKEMSKTDDTIIVYERDKDEAGVYQKLWTISSRNNESLDLSGAADENQDGVESVDTGSVVTNTDREYFMAMYPDRANTDNQIIAENFDGFGLPLIHNEMELEAVEGIKTNIYRLKFKNPSEFLLNSIKNGELSYSIHEIGAGAVNRVGDMKYIFDADKFVEISSENSSDIYYIYRGDIDVSGLAATIGEIRVYANYSTVVMDAEPTKKDILLGLVNVEKDFVVDETKKPSVELVDGISYAYDGTDKYLKINGDNIVGGARTKDETSHMDLGRIVTVDFDSIDGNLTPSISYPYDMDLEVVLNNEVHSSLVELNEKTSDWQDFNADLSLSSYSESRKYLLMAMARNNAGVSYYAYELLKLDKTPPSLLDKDLHEVVGDYKYFKTDETGNSISGTVTVQDTASGVAKVIIKVTTVDPDTGETIIVAQGETAVDSSIKDAQTVEIGGIDISGLASDKTYNMEVIVEDLAGSQTSETIEGLVVDSNPPTISSKDLTVEINGTKYIKLSEDGNAVDFTVTANDSETGIEKAKVEIYNGTTLVLSDEVELPAPSFGDTVISIASDVTGLLNSNIDYDIKVTVYDASGKGSSVTDNGTYDGTAPSYVRSDIYEDLTVNEVLGKYMKVNSDGTELDFTVTASDSESGIKSVTIEIWESTDDTIDSGDRHIMTVVQNGNAGEEQTLSFKDVIPTENPNVMEFNRDHIVKITIEDNAGRETEEIISGLRRQAVLSVVTEITNPSGNEFNTESIQENDGSEKKYIYFTGRTKAVGAGENDYSIYIMKYILYKAGSTEEVSSKQFKFETDGFTLNGDWYSKTDTGVEVSWKNIGSNEFTGREFKVMIPVEDLEFSQAEMFDLLIEADFDFEQDGEDGYTEDKKHEERDIVYDAIKPVFYSFSVKNSSLVDLLQSLTNDGAQLDGIVGVDGNLEETTELKYSVENGTRSASFVLEGGPADEAPSGMNYFKKTDKLDFTITLKDSSFISDGNVYGNVSAVGDFSGISTEIGADSIEGVITKTGNDKEIKITWTGIEVSAEDSGIKDVTISVNDKYDNLYSAIYEIGYSDPTAPTANLSELGFTDTNSDYEIEITGNDNGSDIKNGNTGVRAFIVKYSYAYKQSDWDRKYLEGEVLENQTEMNHHLDKRTLGTKTSWLAAVEAVKDGDIYKVKLRKKIDVSGHNDDGEYILDAVYAVDYAGNIDGISVNLDDLVEKDEKNNLTKYDGDTVEPDILEDSNRVADAVLEKTEDANGIDLLVNDYVKYGDRAKLRYRVVDRNASIDPADYTIENVYPRLTSITDESLVIEIGEVKEGQGRYNELREVEIIVTSATTPNNGFKITATDEGKIRKSLPLNPGKDTVGNINSQFSYHTITLDNEVPDTNSIQNMQIIPKEEITGWSDDTYEGIKWDAVAAKTNDAKVDWAYTRESTAYIAWTIDSTDDLYSYSMNGDITVANFTYSNQTVDGITFYVIPTSVGPGLNTISVVFYDQAGNRIGEGEDNNAFALEIVRNEIVGADAVNLPDLLQADKLSLTGKAKGDSSGYFEFKVPMRIISEFEGLYKYKLLARDKETNIVIDQATFSAAEDGDRSNANGNEVELSEIQSLYHYKTLTVDPSLRDRNIKLRIPVSYDKKEIIIESTVWDQLGNSASDSAEYLPVFPDESIKIISTQEGTDKKIETEMKRDSADVFEVQEREESGIKEGELPESLRED